MTAISLKDLPEYFAQDGYSDYVIEGVLPIGVTVAYGPAGTGKTGFAVATAMAVATGSSWAERNVSKGAVLYAATEDMGGVLKRLHGAATAGGDHSPPVHAVDEATALADPKKGIAILVERIAEFGVSDSLKLIVVDTLARSFGPFSQDDSNHAAAFMANMDTLSKRYGCAVLVIHHTGKDGSMRASQVFRDAADALLRLTPGSKGGGPIVKVEKQRNGPAEGAFSFTIGSTFIKRGTEEVRQISVQAITGLHELSQSPSQVLEEPAVEPFDDRALRVLREMVAQGVTHVTVKEWQDGCYALWSDAKDGTKRARFCRARKALEENKKITVKADVVTLAVTRNNNAGNGPSVAPTVASHPLKGEGGGNVGGDDWAEEVLETPVQVTVQKRSAG